MGARGGGGGAFVVPSLGEGNIFLNVCVGEGQQPQGCCPSHVANGIVTPLLAPSTMYSNIKLDNF